MQIPHGLTFEKVEVGNGSFLVTNRCRRLCQRIQFYNLKIRLSPLKSPILRKYINPFKRPGTYPSISKCNAKKCNCCNHLCSKTTITSSVNGRTFSVVNDSDLD